MAEASESKSAVQCVNNTLNPFFFGPEIQLVVISCMHHEERRLCPPRRYL